MFIETNLIFLGILGISLFALFAYFVYQKVEYHWLDKVCSLLVLSFPFQGFPSLLGDLANLRISQVIVLIGLFLVFLLFIKKDSQLMSQKINFFVFWAIGFFLVSLPSWFLVINFSRFLQFTLGIVLVFGATFLLSHFAENIFEKVKLLILSMIFTSIFAIYQFSADMLGFSEFSLLQWQYTKVVFGIPRVHSFFLEPLLFAGGLFFPIIFFAAAFLSNQRLFEFSKLKNINWLQNPKLINLGLLLLFGLVFAMTYSKSAFLVMAIIFLILFILAILKYKDWLLIKFVTGSVILGIILIITLSLIWPSFGDAISEINTNFIDTIAGRTPSSVERDIFIQSALLFLPDFIVTGTGSGQFAPIASFSLRFLGRDVSSVVINNIYLEIWFEHGFLALLLFLGLWLHLLWDNFKKLKNTQNWKTKDATFRVSLVLSLIAYLIQWLFFSPLYIMPIFILLGLLLALDKQNLATKTNSSVN